jgi:hypothetical protein
MPVQTYTGWGIDIIYLQWQKAEMFVDKNRALMI